MKVQNELKEIFFDCWNSAINNVGTGTPGSGFFDWIEKNQNKILALGKPEPLAKNKQTENVCLNEKCFLRDHESTKCLAPSKISTCHVRQT